MNEANKVKLGAFLLISITLLVVSFLSIGVAKIFSAKYHAMTVLNTSVEGLAIGSPVKYLGMPIGKVTGMAMRESDGCIAVYFDIFPSAVETESPDTGDFTLASNTNIRNLMQRKNLMCFLNAAGLMGGSYLELSISDSSQPALPHLEVTPPAGVTYIPSRPSHIGNAIQNISRMLDELEKVNFIQLADKLNQTLDNMSEILTQSELRHTLKSVNTICENLESSISRLQSVLSEENVGKLNRAIDNIDVGMTTLRNVTDQHDLGETITNLNAFLLQARTALNDAQEGGKALSGDAAAMKLRLEMTLTRLDNTLKELAGMAENLSQDPSQLVRGRQEPPVLPESRR